MFLMPVLATSYMNVCRTFHVSITENLASLAQGVLCLEAVEEAQVLRHHLFQFQVSS